MFQQKCSSKSMHFVIQECIFKYVARLIIFLKANVLINLFVNTVYTWCD